MGTASISLGGSHHHHRPTTRPRRAGSRRSLVVATWIAQGLLALTFSLSGLIKLTRPFAELTKSMPWVASAQPWLVRSIGVVELLGAAGLLLPALVRSKNTSITMLTELAALGLTMVMLLATALHISRGEFFMLPINLVLASMALLVAWGRRPASSTI